MIHFTKLSNIAFLKTITVISAKVHALIQQNVLRLEHETKPHSSCISVISEPSMWFITLQIIMSLLVYRRTQDNLLRSLSPLPGWVRPANHSPDPSSNKDKVRKGPSLATPDYLLCRHYYTIAFIWEKTANSNEWTQHVGLKKKKQQRVWLNNNPEMSIFYDPAS